MSPSLATRGFDAVSRFVMDKYCAGGEEGLSATGSASLQRAMERCSGAPSRSSSVPSPYPNSYEYCGVNANKMYYEAGDNDWGQQVRGCLVCMDQEGADPHESHIFCYGEGTKKAEGLIETAKGYGKAALTAMEDLATKQAVKWVLDKLVLH